MPRGELPPALGDAEKSLAKAVKDKARADKAWHEASQRSALAAEKRKDLRDRMEESKDLLAQAETVAAAEARLGEARIRARRSRERDRAAGAELERLSSLERTAFRSFEEARDRVASLGPPSSNREDLRGSWTELAAWAGKERAVRIEAARAAVKAVEDLESEQEKKEAALVSRCRDLEVRVDGRPRDAIVAALAKAERDLEAIAEGLARIACLREAVKKEAEDARVAGALGQHLRSTGFERWLLEEAFERLVDGATRILKELSSGQYSFEYDERLNFEVIDHRNADERRSARTLSGGETFLASLALALTLAEQTVELAASGSARLESLFLDEGFGTLDDETLEVVASTIDELGTRGRMVGVVTHQQNLASRIPVQYRVSKNPVTSTVTKVVS
jgi:exonuclease SbcC